MTRYSTHLQNKCGCGGSYKCSCEHENKNNDDCSLLPVSDAFINNLTTDSLSLNRQYISIDHCGRSIPKCQKVSVSGDSLLNYVQSGLDVCDLLGDVPSSPTQLCYT